MVPNIEPSVTPQIQEPATIPQQPDRGIEPVREPQTPLKP